MEQPGTVVGAASDTDTDADWVNRAGRGDRAALSELFRRLGPKLRASLNRQRFADEDDDLVEEIIDQIFSAPAIFQHFSGRNGASLGGYLRAIASNRLMAHRRRIVRRNQRVRIHSLDAIEANEWRRPSELANADPSAAQLYVSELVAWLSQWLDPRDQQIFRMIVDDFSHREIGAHVGMKPQTVKTRIHKIRTKLKPVAERAFDFIPRQTTTN